LNQEPSPGIEYEYRLVQQLLPGVSLEDVTTLARSRLAGDDRVVLAITPQKEGIRVPTEADLQSAIGEGDKVAVTPWSDGTTDRALLDKIPEPARIESRRELADIGVTVVKFANGVEAWLKPTDFKNDQVMFTLEALGGSSLAPEADYLQATDR